MLSRAVVVAACVVSLGSMAPLALAGCSLHRSPLETPEQREASAIASAGGGASDAGTSSDDPFGNHGGGTSGMGAGTNAAGSGGVGGTLGGAGSAGTPGCGPSGCPNGIDPGLLANGACEPTGVFGLRFSTDVAWGGRNTPLGYITDNGRGRIVVHLRVTVSQVNPDGTFTADVVPCNTELPAFFSTILCEVYQPLFPTAMWDSPQMRTLQMNGRYDCTTPGCVMHLMPATALIGIDLGDENAVWPATATGSGVQCSAGSNEACFVDHDSDTQRGVTTSFTLSGATPPNSVCTSGYPFRPAPLTSDPLVIASGAAPRALQLYLGVRVRFGGDGTITPGCGQRNGQGVAYGFDSRAIGCKALTGQTCDASQQSFMDANLPIYQVLTAQQVPPAALDLPDKSPSKGTLISLTRLANAGEQVSCAAVRSAPY